MNRKQDRELRRAVRALLKNVNQRLALDNYPAAHRAFDALKVATEHTSGAATGAYLKAVLDALKQKRWAAQHAEVEYRNELRGLAELLGAESR